MVNENKSNIFAAVAGAVVGAGVAIAGAVALSDKSNQKKIDETVNKGQKIANDYSEELEEKVGKVKKIVKETVETGKGKADKLVKVIKTAQKGVKNL